MDNNITLWFIAVFALILALMAIIVIFTGDHEHRRRHKKKRHKLKLQVHFQTKIKHHLMASINSITLTDLLPHTGLITVVDSNGKSYTGTLSNVAVVVADPSQDTVAVDPNVPSTLDVTDVSPNGGTTAVVIADFASAGNEGIEDGKVFTGLTCTVTIINKIPSEVQLSLQVNF